LLPRHAANLPSPSHSGVNVKHVELEGRAKWGKTIPNDADEDSNGHGSHVAVRPPFLSSLLLSRSSLELQGTIASAKYGVAKKANIIAVKVLGAGGSGTMSDVVAGVAWAADSAAEALQLKAQGKNSKHKGSVANMSLGGGKSQALDDAVNAAVEDGLHFAVAVRPDFLSLPGLYSPASLRRPVTTTAMLAPTPPLPLRTPSPSEPPTSASVSTSSLRD
jgi:cerevisin